MDAAPINLYTPKYEVELWDINGVFTADVSDIITGNLNYDMPLNDVEGLSFTIDLVQFENMCASIGANPRNILEPYRTDVKIKRDGAYIVGTQVVRVQTNFNNKEANKIIVQCTGYLNYFKDRYITAKDWGTNYQNRTYAEIARQLITDTQSQTNGNFGVTLGTDSASAGQVNTRSRYEEYDNQNVKDGIINLTRLENDNFDFEFTPNKVFNIFARKGSDMYNVELVYPQNIQSIQVTRDASTLANKIIGLGSGIGEERLEDIEIDATSALTYRVRERPELFNSVSTPSVLEANTLGKLAQYKDIYEVPAVTVTPNEFDLNTIKTGDAIVLRVTGSTFVDDLYGLYRITNINVSVTQVGEESVKIDVVKWGV